MEILWYYFVSQLRSSIGLNYDAWCTLQLESACERWVPSSTRRSKSPLPRCILLMPPIKLSKPRMSRTTYVSIWRFHRSKVLFNALPGIFHWRVTRQWIIPGNALSRVGQSGCHCNARYLATRSIHETPFCNVTISVKAYELQNGSASSTLGLWNYRNYVGDNVDTKRCTQKM